MKHVIAAFFVFYVLVAQWLIPLNDWREVYPFFHWSLFSEVQPQRRIYRLELYALDSKERCWFEQCRLVPPALKSTQFFYLIQSLGTAIKLNSAEWQLLLEQTKRQLGAHVSNRYAVTVYESDIHLVDFAQNKLTHKDTQLLSFDLGEP